MFGTKVLFEQRVKSEPFMKPGRRAELQMSCEFEWRTVSMGDRVRKHRLCFNVE